MSFADAELTRDGFLGGALQFLQPRIGYRAGTDPVFLAASVPQRPGETALELGCGAGVAALCLAKRSGEPVVGVEMQPAYAELAHRNAQNNGLTLDVVTADIRDLPPSLRQQSFHHLFLNPPYFEPETGVAPKDAGKGMAFVEEVPLGTWIDVALRRTRPKGTVTLIQRADRLADILGALRGRCGDIRVLPLAARTGRPARRVIVQARLASAAPLRLLAPFHIHDGDMHQRDGDDYSLPARAVLRDGKMLRALTA